MLKKDLKTKKILEKRITELENEFLVTGIPIGHAVNSIVPGDTVMNMPNAQVIGNQNVPMVYLNGDAVPYGYASPGNDIKVLEIFEGMLLVLIPNGSGAEGDGQWSIGYLETSVLGNTVEINYNTITWNDGSDIEVVDGNGDFLYTLPATQTIQFLYETPNNNYACILFNGNSGALQTGYVSMSEGTFYRYSYLRSGALQAPGIANNSTPASTSGSITATLLEQAAIMIALDEGFSSEPYDFGVGKYGNSAGYGTYVGEFSQSQFPLSPETAWEVLLEVLENNYIPDCDKYIEQYLGDITDCQKCAIYAFGYNLEGWVEALCQKLAQNDSWENTFANFLIPASLYARRHRSWLTYTTNTFNLQTSNISELPASMQSLAQQMSGEN